MSERVYVACDVSNIWKSCKDQFGQKARVDFEILSRLMPARRHPHACDQELVAYLVTNPKQNHHHFYNTLRGYGYGIKERFMRYEKSSGKPTRTDWDVGITLDAVDKLNTYDTFALFSGDGDFTQVIQFLKGKKKRTVVVSFENSMSNKLSKAADEFVELTEKFVYYREG